MASQEIDLKRTNAPNASINLNEARKDERLPAFFSFSGSCAFPPATASNQPSKEDFRKQISTNLGDEEISFRSKVEAILREWISICYTSNAQIEPQHAFASISRMVCLNI